MAQAPRWANRVIRATAAEGFVEALACFCPCSARTGAREASTPYFASLTLRLTSGGSCNGGATRAASF